MSIARFLAHAPHGKFDFESCGLVLAFFPGTCIRAVLGLIGAGLAQGGPQCRRLVRAGRPDHH